MRILVILILIVFAGQLCGQRKSPEENAPPIERPLDEWEYKELARDLYAPAAIDRLNATLAMNELELFTEKYLKFIYEHHTEVFLDIFYRVWPKDGDKFIDTLYEIEDEDYKTVWVETAADILYSNDKLNRMAEDLKVSAIIRDLWYRDWKTRIPKSVIWPEMYKEIASTKWLYDKFVADSKVAEACRAVATFFADDYDDIADSIGWRKMLWETKNGVIPKSGVYYIEDTVVGTIDAAIAICIILNNIDWLNIVKKEIDATIEIIAAKKPIVWDRTRWNSRIDIFLKRDSKLEDFKAIFNDRSNIRFNKKILLYHSWFSDLRKQDGFIEWWNDTTHQYRYKEPDILFKNTNWHTLADRNQK